MKALRMIQPLGSFCAKRESEQSTLLRRAVRWGLVVLLPLLVVGSLTTTRAFAQEAELSGIVSDPSGGRVPNANITVVNRDTGYSAEYGRTSGGVIDAITRSGSTGSGPTIAARSSAGRTV